MEKIYYFKNSQIRVVFGDITQCKTDVIVSSDDCFISRSGGVSRRIDLCAGEAILDDIRKHIPAQLGDVVVTSAGKLSNKYIFHIITIGEKRFSLGSKNDILKDSDCRRDIIENSINKSFRLLLSLDLTSIAFPAIGAGVAKIPYEEVASYMIRSIATNLLRTNKSIKVELYLYDRFGKMTEWDFLPFFEKIGKYLPEENLLEPEEIDETKDEYLNVVDENSVIFISYSRRDKEQASAICQILNKYNISYWIDEEGKYSGSNFKGVIVEQIKKSSIVLFLSSKDSNLSKNVEKEIGLAVKYEKYIIPIKLDSYSYSSTIEYDLCNIDYIEYNSNDTFENKLINNIKVYL